MGGSPGHVSEEPVKGWRISCDAGEATEGLENELWRRWSDGKLGEWADDLVNPYMFQSNVIIYSRYVVIR